MSSERVILFQQILDQVFLDIEAKPWYQKASNYTVVINETDTPRTGDQIILATTTRGGGVPTQIIYYVQNFTHLSYAEIYRVTRHEFAHLWSLGETDAQAVE